MYIYAIDKPLSGLETMETVLYFEARDSGFYGLLRKLLSVRRRANTIYIYMYVQGWVNAVKVQVGYPTGHEANSILTAEPPARKWYWYNMFIHTCI